MAHKLSMAVQDVRLRTGRPVLVLEVAQPSPSATSKDVAELAAQVPAARSHALSSQDRRCQADSTVFLYPK